MLAIFAAEGGWEDMDPEQMKAAMQPWTDFERELADANAFVAGDGLQPSSTATTIGVGEGGDRPITDGPFAETKEQLGGFYLVECDSLDEAIDWAKKIPVSAGASIEVRPVMDYTQFGMVRPAEATGAAS
jgi:hypothetical protein